MPVINLEMTVKDLVNDVINEMSTSEFNSWVDPVDYLHWYIEANSEDALHPLLLECSEKYQRMHSLATSLYVSGLPVGTDERLHEIVEIITGKIIL